MDFVGTSQNMLPQFEENEKDENQSQLHVTKNDVIDNKGEVYEGTCPKVGMVFNNVEEAYDFYNDYAKEVGFSVRKRRTNKCHTDPNKIRLQRLCCSHEGEYAEVNPPKKKRDSKRFGCEAVFEIGILNDDKYVLKKFNAEHNHELVPPDKSHLLRSHRRIEFSQARTIKRMCTSGMHPSDILSYIYTEFGGAHNCNFVEVDCNHLTERTRAKYFRKGDAQCLINYFKEKKGENKQFFYSFQANEDNELSSVFFCDAKSRYDYTLFGDVIAFDTTFKINYFDLVCAPIIGVNNHRQTIIFGCGLLDGENIDAVVWLFNTFLEAMGGKKPTSIFTDQSLAIVQGISMVFPKCHHRLCLWNIHENVMKHLPEVSFDRSLFTQQLNWCIYNAETNEEFETSWDKLLEDYGLRDSEKLQAIYGSRHKWAQAYAYAHFCAGLTTTWQSESMNIFLKQYFGSNFTLKEFVGQYAKAMSTQQELEREQQNERHQIMPQLLSDWPVEKEAATKYTMKIFYEFQAEYKKVLNLRLELERDDGIIRTYQVKSKYTKGKVHTLKYNSCDQFVSCSCRKFEFDGILCSHALSVFHELEFTSLPSQYYLKRWTRAITDEVIFDQYGDVIQNDVDPSTTARHNELSHISQKIVAKGARSKKLRTFVRSKLLELEVHLDAYLNTDNAESMPQKNETSIRGDDMIQLTLT